MSTEFSNPCIFHQEHELFIVSYEWETVDAVGNRLNHRLEKVVCKRCGGVINPFAEFTEAVMA